MFTITGGAGTCQVRFDQTGDNTYGPASQVVETVTVQKANQTISFEPLTAKTYGDPDIAVVALASSSLPVSLSAGGSCGISGAILHLTGAGSCTVTASQAGDANYNAAPTAAQTFAVAKANQTITFLALPRKRFGDRDFTVGASASSDLPVTFTANGRCAIRHSSGKPRPV